MEKIIESIVQTYDLPVKKKNKIISIAIQQIKSFEGFKDAYDYINFLVERFCQTPYTERFFTRLDHLVKEDSDTKFHELIYMPAYLKEDNQKDLKEKLKGQSSILGRPIIQIEPFIKLGRRKYNKKPLVLFRKHEYFYRGKSRTEVYHIDPGMYEALRIWNQLHVAIPQVKIIPYKRISKKKEKEIIEASKIFTSPTDIARKLNTTRATVDYYTIKKHKLRNHNKKGPIGYPKQMIKDIVECLRECKIASRVAEWYDVSIRMVINHGREAGVPILSRGGNRRQNKKHTPKTF
ncbi:hypothetical protein KAT80_02560 [Candidatus Pacearchaeota archaeon]|nr:hypothetical protein [Candidatus Pacearchaeota archaeon]